MSDFVPQPPLLERKSMLEEKLNKAMAEHGFVKYCLNERKKQAHGVQPGPWHLELKEHLDDLRLQDLLYKSYINSLITEIRLSEKGLVSSGTRTWEQFEKEVEELNRKIKEKFNRYQHLEHLEKYYKK